MDDGDGGVEDVAERTDIGYQLWEQQDSKERSSKTCSHERAWLEG